MAEVRSQGAETMVCAVDLREPQSAKIIIEGTLERFGRIDALLNIAGAVAEPLRLGLVPERSAPADVWSETSVPIAA